jgi:hypothetical protein
MQMALGQIPNIQDTTIFMTGDTVSVEYTDGDTMQLKVTRPGLKSVLRRDISCKDWDSDSAKGSHPAAWVCSGNVFNRANARFYQHL